MTPEFDFTGTPLTLAIGQPAAFTSTCKDAASYWWSFGDGQTSSLPSPSHSYGQAGLKTVELSITTRFGSSGTISKPFYVDVQACAPGNPKAVISYPSGTIKEGALVNSCSGGLTGEVVTFTDASFPDACSFSPIDSRVWSLNGAAIPNSNVASLPITLSQSGSNPAEHTVGLTVQDDAGRTNSTSLKVKVVPCAFSFKSAAIKVNNLEDGGRRIFGSQVPDVDGNGVAHVSLEGEWESTCPCKFTVSVDRWKVDENTFFTPTLPNVALNGYDDHHVELHLVARQGTTIVGTEIVRLTLRAVPPEPATILARFGCLSPPRFTNSLWNEDLPSDNLDLSKSLQEMNPTGTGFGGRKDEAFLRVIRVASDFTLTARILNGAADAGLVLRNSLSPWDRSLFVGRQAGHYLVADRPVFFQETQTQSATSRDDMDCFRIKRQGQSVFLFAARSVSGLCPYEEADWTAVDLGGITEFKGWGGNLPVALSAAGTAATVSFDGVAMDGLPPPLSRPNTIMKSDFADGNLMPNWSFESNRARLVKTGTSIVYEERFEETAVFADKAYHGKHFLRITDKSAGSSISTQPQTARINNYRIQKDYGWAWGLRVQYQYRLSQPPMNLHPVMRFFLRDGTFEDHDVEMPALPTYYAGIWMKAVSTVPIPPEAITFSLYLLGANQSFSSASVDFDDILIAPIFGGESHVPTITMSYADGYSTGFQKVVQTEVEETGTLYKEDIVTATLLDEQGRTERTLPALLDRNLPFDPNGEEIRDVKRDPLQLMEFYYAEQDILKDFTLDPIDRKPDLSAFQEGHGGMSYENSPLGKVVASTGRLPSHNIRSIYASAPDVDPVRTVNTTVSYMDIQGNNGRTMEEQLNAYGYMVKSKVLGPTPSDDLVTQLEPDILGRVWRSVTPMGSASSTEYNSLDQAIRSDDPDRGWAETLYDRLGRARLMRDASKDAKDQFIAYVYDAFSRVTEVFLVTDGTNYYWSQTFADSPDWPKYTFGSNLTKQLLVRNVYDKATSDPPGLGSIGQKNLKTRLAMTTSYSASGEVTAWFSYDTQGKVERIWKKILDLPVQTHEFQYNQGGLLKKKIVRGFSPDDGVFMDKSFAYAYDHLNRLQSVSDEATGERIAELEYWPDGKVRKKYLGPGKNQAISFAYDPAERLIQQRHEKRDPAQAYALAASGTYAQELFYGDKGTLDRQLYQLDRPGGAVPNPFRGVMYSYDHFLRLEDADFGKGNAKLGTDPAQYAATDFDATYLYNEDGAISHAAMGDITVPREYAYKAGTHQLDHIGTAGQRIITGGKDRSQGGNYLYDPSGNLVADRAAKRKIDYDYRGLPVKIWQCENIDGTGNCVGATGITEMVYDTDGNRVAKIKRK